MLKQKGTPINRWLLLSLAVLLSANAVGQDPSMTDGELNGRWWEELGSASHAKEMYLAGFTEGVQVGAEEMNRLRGLSNDDKVAAAISTYHAKGSSLDDNIKELDKLYADRENIRIPVSAAIVYCTIKLGGRFTNAQLEQILITARKALPAPEERKPRSHGDEVRTLLAMILMTISRACLVNAQTEKTFPTDDEINLVLAQTERAVQQYKPLIDQEEVQMGRSGEDAVTHDRQVVNALETAVKAFKGKPQGFNGPLGFAFFEWLDDADRNAVLCGSGASAQAALQMRAGNTDKAASLLHLAQSCSDVSALIYTVSENAGALYQRYVEAEEQLAGRGIEMLGKCTDILKKNSTPPKK